MNTYTTRPAELFNQTGILWNKGEYAGEFIEEAYKILEGEFDNFNQKTLWADIFINERTGKEYAVVSDSELTSYSGNLVYCEL